MFWHVSTSKTKKHKNQHNKAFVVLMEKELLSSANNNPLDHSIESVLPGIHSRLSAMQSEVSSSKRTMETSLNEVRSDLASVVSEIRSMMELNQANQRAFADHLRHIADGIYPQGRNVRRRLELPTNIVHKEEDQKEEEQDQENQVPEVNYGGIPLVAKSHHINFKHSSLLSMHDEWFGLGASYDKPIKGGLEELKKKYKAKWRKHFAPSEEKALSRLKRIIGGLKKEAERTGEVLSDVCIHLSPSYEDACKKSLSKMESWMKKEGMINAGTARSRSAN